MTTTTEMIVFPCQQAQGYATFAWRDHPERLQHGQFVCGECKRVLMRCECPVVTEEVLMEGGCNACRPKRKSLEGVQVINIQSAPVMILIDVNAGITAEMLPEGLRHIPVLYRRPGTTLEVIPDQGRPALILLDPRSGIRPHELTGPPSWQGVPILIKRPDTEVRVLDEPGLLEELRQWPEASLSLLACLAWKARDGAWLFTTEELLALSQSPVCACGHRRLLHTWGKFTEPYCQVRDCHCQRGPEE